MIVTNMGNDVVRVICTKRQLELLTSGVYVILHCKHVVVVPPVDGTEIELQVIIDQLLEHMPDSHDMNLIEVRG